MADTYQPYLLTLNRETTLSTLQHHIKNYRPFQPNSNAPRPEHVQPYLSPVSITAPFRAVALRRRFTVNPEIVAAAAAADPHY